PEAPHLDGVREIGRTNGGEIRDLAWSPDGRWLVWSEPTPWHLGRLMISDTEDAEPMGRALTSGKYQDAAPAFSADGKHLALLSLRTFETVYDDMVFDLGFVNAERPFLIPLERSTPDPFGPQADGWGLSTEDDKAAQKTGDADSAGHGAAAAAVTAAGAAGSAADHAAGVTSPSGADEATKPPVTRRSEERRVGA